jgi:outer membrane protein insertion porin family
MDMTDLRRSAGFGVRMLVNPIGLIGFDYGYGYDAATPDGSPPGWKFHFQFGKSF